MNQAKSSQKWLWVGFTAALLSALMTGLALFSHFQPNVNVVFLWLKVNPSELLFTMLYAITLMVVPFALWHRIVDDKRKWTSRVCNGLTTSTATWASLTYVTAMDGSLSRQFSPGIAKSLLNGLFAVGSVGAMLSMSACMGFMGWSLWRGKSRWFGSSAVFLAISPYLHISPTFPEWVRVIWLLWLAMWFVQPVYDNNKGSLAGSDHLSIRPPHT